MQLYDHAAKRLYINKAERNAFIAAARLQPIHIRAFAFTLLFTGCRVSEARALEWSNIQCGDQLISIRSLKKRERLQVREVPVPKELIRMICSLEPIAPLVWPANKGPVPRITAYRWVKEIMVEANIFGPQACPKGLRHGFGIHAVRSGVQLNMLQKWMGHADIQTTAIYADAVGREEHEIAARMWV